MRCLSSSIIAIVITLHAAAAAAGELYDAALADNAQEVRRLVLGGVPVDDTGDLGSPLHAAVFRGNAAMVAFLIDSGADLEKPSAANGSHPLHVAARYGHPEIVALLLDRGADPDVLDGDGRPALYVAALSGDVAVGQVLLDHRAHVTAGGYPSLHAAVYHDNPPFVALLLAYGADVNGFDVDGMTPLLIAAKQGSPELIELLIGAGADLQAHGPSGVTAVMLASDNFHKGSLGALLRAGAKP